MINPILLRLIFPFFILLTMDSFAQQGKPAIPEEEGKKQLQQFATTYRDRAGWEKELTSSVKTSGKACNCRLCLQKQV